MKMLVIADDLTGALDTTAKLVDNNISTLVSLSYEQIGDREVEKYDVIVVDIDSRHLDIHKAEQRIVEVIDYFERYEIEYIYKKTDSALRGNIGCELSKLLELSVFNELHFIPAFPEMDRTTIDGIQYVNGIKLEDSVFAMDPFEPVKHSYVDEIIGIQSNVKCINTKFPLVKTEGDKIYIYDAKTDDDILEIAKTLYYDNRLKLMAGCAGFSNILSNVIKFNKSKEKNSTICNRFLIVSGSVNPVTKQQVEYAINSGFNSVAINREQLETRDDFWKSKDGDILINEIREKVKEKNTIAYIDSLFNKPDDFDDKYRFKIADSMGEIAKILIEDGSIDCVMIIGGDTLRGLCNVADIKLLKPIKEITQGVIESTVNLSGRVATIISKSGGLGNKDVLEMISSELEDRGNEDDRK